MAACLYCPRHGPRQPGQPVTSLALIPKRFPSGSEPYRQVWSTECLADRVGPRHLRGPDGDGLIRQTDRSLIVMHVNTVRLSHSPGDIRDCVF